MKVSFPLKKKILIPPPKPVSQYLFLCSWPFFDRIDKNLTIKVADFGLSEDIKFYCRNYFKQGQVSEEGATVKLPIRWMALESLLDSIFTEKTDVDICARLRVKMLLFFILVVVWCDLLGGV